MKAIIQAYSPEELERIARGEQTVKVCKTAPKDTPFKVYMYKKLYAGGAKIINEVLNGVYSGGKVVGEYVCDKVIKYDYQTIACVKYEVNGADVKEELRYNAGACLNSEEMYSLSNGKDLRGLHIPAVKFYDEPKKLGEFYTICNKYENDSCGNCSYLAVEQCSYPCDDCVDTWCSVDNIKSITRPPRDWQYVEPLDK